jgi:hypothetical protein
MLVKDNDLSQAKRLAFKLFVVWLIKVLGRKSGVVDILVKVVDIGLLSIKKTFFNQ